MVADVFDPDDIEKVVADIGPEVVVCLLTTLPKWGPKRPARARRKLWGIGASNLVAAAQRAGVRGSWPSRSSSPTATRRPVRNGWTRPTPIRARRPKAGTRCWRRSGEWSRRFFVR